MGKLPLHNGAVRVGSWGALSYRYPSGHPYCLLALEEVLCLEKVPSMLEPLKELFFVGESRSVKILRAAWGSPVSGRSRRAIG